MNLLISSKNLSKELIKLYPNYNTTYTFDKKLYIYNVFEYAWEGWKCYVEKCAKKSATTLLLGINPGPHGMVQTGVPFGNIAAVKNYIKIYPTINQPKKIHPKKKVEGMAYQREEPSGNMFWGGIKSLFPHSNDFFSRCFVLNYCPLAFFTEQGKNITPNILPKQERTRLEQVCSEHLWYYINYLGISRILAVGKYSLEKSLSLCEPYNIIKKKDILYVPHPSPLNRNRHNFVPTIKKLLL